MKQVTPLPWKKTVADVTLAQKVRAVFFYVTTFVVAAPLFVLMLVLHPFVLLFDKHRRKAHHLVNKVKFEFVESQGQHKRYNVSLWNDLCPRDLHAHKRNCDCA
jgi:hypothetical protein